MKTYQDLMKVVDNQRDLITFIEGAIKEHMSSSKYYIARDADMYYKHQNPTIMRAQKFIYNVMGKAVPDIYSANNKIPSNFFNTFVTQQVQYLLGNGTTFSEDQTKQKLGSDFDQRLQELATYALIGSCAYGYWNHDHMQVFDYLEFVPIYDEENGTLRAGIRFWQIDPKKPLRVTLYQEDGYTEYMRKYGEIMQIMYEKRSYKQIVMRTEADGVIGISDGGNYPSFPIIPLYNENKQSAIVGGRETIDAYDLMASQMVNNIDDGNLIYWVLKNCGGMDAQDDEKFIEQLKMTHVAHADGDTGAGVQAHEVQAPYAANEVALQRLRSQLFDDFMALDTKDISGGAVTATQIRAAYEPLNNKVDKFEYCVLDFMRALLTVAGINDTPTFSRSAIINKTDEIQLLLQASQYLDRQYVTEKILTTLGDADKLKQVLDRMMFEEADRYEVEHGRSVLGREEDQENL